MLSRVWEDVPADDAGVDRLASALAIPPVIARLLWQRGLEDPESASRFLEPSLANLHNPFLLAGMRESVDRILGAVARRERIAIHGDYDVDGMTSTAILRRAIELLGGDVEHFVPDRFKDGYGLQSSTIERLHAAGVRLVISVDCGIRAAEAAIRARELGLDLIITDHHEPDAALPAALAVINPKRADCAYPDKHLAGVGVALKLVQGLWETSGRTRDGLSHFLKIAALGTLADVVPLVGENRIIARHGLAALSAGPHGAGLEALLEETGLLGKKLDSFHVGFVLAPRLNAAGRMSSADIALDLLLMRGRDEATRARARGLARQLSEENARRQEQEAAILAEARRAIDKDPETGAQNMLIVAGEDWHRGVIGIVASKLAEAYCKPVLVLSLQDGIAQGSGRSIRAFDLLAALESCADVFLRFGGHRQAAGVTLEAGRVGELRRRLCAWANERLSPEDLMPRLRIDSPLGLREISGEVIEGLSRLGPFGAANAKPIFRASPVDLMEAPRVLKERHLALLVRQQGRAFRAIAWRAAERGDYLSANRVGLELAYSLDQNTFRGETTTELTVADVRVPALGGDRVNWQKRARIAVAVIGFASAATLYFLLGKRLPPPVQVTDPARDPQATNETGPGDMTSLQSNGEPAWHVKFDRSSSYADGRMKFGKPHFVSPRGSQPLELWSDEAVAKKRVGAGSGSGDVDLTGHVVMQTASAWHVESDTATYEEATNLLRMPGAVTFSHDSMSGSSQGATYDRDTQVLVLLADPHVTVKPDATGEGSLDASAVRMTIDRAAKYVLLHDQARITRDKEVFSADEATLRLTEDEKSVRAVELRGRASVTPRPGADKPPPEMHADEIDLSMQPDGKSLHTGALRRHASLTLMGSAGANRIDGQTIGFGLAADGQTVSKLDASGRVALGLPRTADTGARSITAETLASTGDEKSGLKELKFDGAGGVVTFTEAQPAAGGTPASTRTGLSKLLTLNLDGDLGAITSAEFRREVKFTKDADVSATADRAVYFEPKAGSTARLWLYKEGTRALPRVVNADKGITIEAELVKIDIDSNDVDATGTLQPVQTVSKPASDPAAAGPKPGLFASGQKIIGTGSAVTYRTKTDEATYTSTEKIHAMVQQEDGNNRISADKVTVNKQTNDLTATGHVDSRFVSDPKPSDGRSSTPASGNSQQYVVRAATMQYTDATRVAHYVGTKGEPAEIESQDGLTHGQTLDVFLDDDGRSVKRLVADGQVYTRNGVREATGDHLIWIAAVGAKPDSYTITGRPVYVKEPKQPKPAAGKPDCNWSLYHEVTFSSGDMDTPRSGQGQIGQRELACSMEIPGKRGGL